MHLRSSCPPDALPYGASLLYPHAGHHIPYCLSRDCRSYAAVFSFVKLNCLLLYARENTLKGLIAVPNVDSKYLKNMPSSDPYGDEDGFDMDIDLDWTEEELNDPVRQALLFEEEENSILLEESSIVSRNEAGYLCCEVNPCSDQRLEQPDPAEAEWETEWTDEIEFVRLAF